MLWVNLQSPAIPWLYCLWRNNTVIPTHCLYWCSVHVVKLWCQIYVTCLVKAYKLTVVLLACKCGKLSKGVEGHWVAMAKGSSNAGASLHKILNVSATSNLLSWGRNTWGIKLIPFKAPLVIWGTKKRTVHHFVNINPLAYKCKPNWVPIC